MAQHTPGPWIAADDRRGIYEILCNGEMLAQVWRVGYVKRDLPAEANARLIAAAPELLAACKRVMQLAVSAEGDEVFAEVKAAIAKAESAT